MNTLKSLIFLIVLPGTVMVYVPYYILSLEFKLFFPEINALKFIGLGPISIGAAIILWCFWDFITSGKGTPAPIDPPKNLVVNGFYRYTRKPMYVGVMFVLCGEILLFESTVLLIYSLIVLLLFHLFVVLDEEPTLKNKFSDSYEQYVESVPRWLPSISSMIKTLK